MPTTILDGETYEQALHRRFTEEAKVIKKMQQDRIIEMAREAGATQLMSPTKYERLGLMGNETIKRFAALVAAHWQKIHQQEMSMMSELCADRILEERELCAKVCEELRHPNYASESDDWIKGTEDCAAAIRARSTKE